MRRFGLVGQSLKHSFSKNFFAAKFEREGLVDCSYELYPLPAISSLPHLIAKYSDWVGLNVTIPYKSAVLQFAHDLSYLPDELRACNCLHFTRGKIVAHNTDVFGFEQSFRSLYSPGMHKKAMVLGNGGAAQAIKFVLNKIGIPFVTVGRALKNDVDMVYAEIDVAIINSHQIIINTTPLGTFPNVNDKPALPYQFLSPQHYLYDLVYNPEETSFLKLGKEAGCRTKNGLEMLELQAEESWRIWNKS